MVEKSLDTQEARKCQLAERKTAFLLGVKQRRDFHVKHGLLSLELN